MFQYLSSQPEKAEQYTYAMKFYTALICGYSQSFLVHGCPWSDLRGGKVVNIGGSNGHVSFSVARQYPRLLFVVQDLHEVVATATAEVPADVVDRVRFAAYDFFTPQSVPADAYLFRWVFNDWADKYVIQILRQMVPILKPGTRTIVNESLCPEPGVLPLSMERTIRLMDMLMLSVNNSRLRDLEDWRQIFQEADLRFGSLRCWTHPMELRFPSLK
ncbi:hypothetical protein MMC17_007093 [Xylographa soralifera]|nr:hypothetical protein [Xylographa soralifera]